MNQENVVDKDMNTEELKRKLKEFGFDDDAMTREEMLDLLKALHNSQNSANQEEANRKKETARYSPELKPRVPKRKINGMERRYVEVADRRLPWSILPPDLTPIQKAAALAVYINFLSKDSYIQARSATTFVQWPPTICLAPENSRVQTVRSTRSGRTVVATYIDSDDDFLEIKETKKNARKRKASDSSPSHGTYSNKTVSLKRKQKVDIENTSEESSRNNGLVEPTKRIEKSNCNKKEKMLAILDSQDEILQEVLADNENLDKSPTLPSMSRQKKKFAKVT